jgi:hypothetical protein
MPEELLRAVEANTEATVAAQGEAAMLRHEVRRQRGWMIALGAALAVVAVLFLAAWSRFGAVLEETHRSLETSERSLERLVECTEPGTKADPHECYDRGQAATASAIGNLVDTDHNGRPDHQEILERQARDELLGYGPAPYLPQTR